MASFLLIHGSWHGAWCWERMLPRLRDAGHEALAIDLPAHGEDRTPAWRVGLGRYARTIAAAAGPLSVPPILVGHSMGGMAITQAARSAPDRFAGLIYLCAFVPRTGDRVLALTRGDVSVIPASTSVGFGRIHFRPERATEAFYGACTPEDAAWATARLRPDPAAPLLQALSGPDTRLPRAAIFCSEDRAISLDRQRSMAARAGVERTELLETDHSPFLSTPDALAETLDRLASAAVRS